MSHFGRSEPPDIRDTYFFLVLNITFCNSPFTLLLILHPLTESPNSISLSLFGTTADDLFPLFDKYGKVVDVFIPRDQRIGDSRGFAFVRYKYQDEAHKAVEKFDGRVVDGREIMRLKEEN
ncbi:hypothetical protein DVH24_001282 [Malus domestica]|uniref:RRM domain-containing protein n=1 Tax=Malus domestica TaxID=3750 RepID=A0A498K169_MALDO|nr:hypothetical protein DVH24_001282 [Malus domestica]